jgi:hypothetical protein
MKAEYKGYEEHTEHQTLSPVFLVFCIPCIPFPKETPFDPLGKILID